MPENRSPWFVPAASFVLVVAVAAGSVALASVTGDGPTVAYPDRPADLSAESATSFASEYERAFAVNEVRDRYRGVGDVEFSVTDSTVLNRTADGYVVHLRIFLSWTRGDSVADQPYAVNYFVNESVVARSEFRASVAPGPDPRRNGTVVEREG